MTYSPEELKRKALFLLKLKRQGDERYLEFCLRLMVRLNTNQHRVETMITNYSKGHI